jgi:hypothetical protein
MSIKYISKYHNGYLYVIQTVESNKVNFCQ